MLGSSRRLCQAATLITKAEFLEAFSRVHPDALQNGNRRLGLAVSGGVDSMALALMCREYLPRDRFELHGLIVDHGLRATSSEEASKTKDLLTSLLSIESHVLKINVSVKPGSKAIETEARTTRYQALTKYCRSKGITDLMSAHHAGDEYETIIMRLIQHSRHSFRMRGVSRVLSCHKYLSEETVPYIWRAPARRSLECLGVSGIPLLDLNLMRPLLSFPKDRLMATCEAFDMPWFEDATNKDRKLTLRNAIRHVLAHYKLPQALSQDSMLAMAKSNQDRIVSHASVANKLFSMTNVRLDVRTGSATITVPTPQDLAEALPRLLLTSSGSSGNSLQHIIAHYVLVVRQLVEPTVLHNRAAFIPPMETLFGAPVERKRFSYGSCLFEPLLDGRWLVSRAPLRRHNDKEHITTCLSLRSRGGQTLRQNPFRLFDSRWWIRLTDPAPETDLDLCYLQPAHLTSLRERLRAGEIKLVDVSDPLGTSRNIDAILQSLGPLSLRWSLPVVVERASATEGHADGSSDTEGASKSAVARDPMVGTVLAFPTLNLRIDDGNRNGIVPPWIKRLEWEVLYKHVNLMKKRVEDCIVLPPGQESRVLAS